MAIGQLIENALFCKEAAAIEIHTVVSDFLSRIHYFDIIHFPLFGTSGN